MSKRGFAIEKNWMRNFINYGNELQNNQILQSLKKCDQDNFSDKDSLNVQNSNPGPIYNFELVEMDVKYTQQL